MLKKIVINVCIILICQISFAQTNYPAGGYKTYEELKNKQPTIPFAFKIKNRSKGGIRMSGGADYKIHCTDGSVYPNEIEYEIYAISTGDSLYINCNRHKAGHWYAKVISEGKYLAFLGPENNVDIATRKYERQFPSGRKDNPENPNKLRYLYYVDLKHGMARPINKILFRKMLEPYSLLYDQYINEPDMDDQQTMLKYFLIYNQEDNY